MERDAYCIEIQCPYMILDIDGYGTGDSPTFYECSLAECVELTEVGNMEYGDEYED